MLSSLPCKPLNRNLLEPAPTSGRAAVPSSFRRCAGARFALCRRARRFLLLRPAHHRASGSKEPLRGVYPLHRVLLLCSTRADLHRSSVSRSPKSPALVTTKRSDPSASRIGTPVSTSPATRSAPMPSLLSTALAVSPPVS